jgi:hypothetical protein
LTWLAGLLEAEGTFLRPPPSKPGSPVVSCRMTDRDVVDRVAERFGTAIIAIDKGRYRTEYATTIKGSRAARLMADLRMLMGKRRRSAIERALALFAPPERKLDYSRAERIRSRYTCGASAASLAREYGVSHPTIRKVLNGRIYREPPPMPWREPATWLPNLIPPAGISAAELYWLAGWLEGEGSFCAPPPSAPRLPRIHGECRDRDVVWEVASLLGVSPTGPRQRNGWSRTWTVLKQGEGAVQLMNAIKPLMSQRRAKQINVALLSRPRQNGRC